MTSCFPFLIDHFDRPPNKQLAFQASRHGVYKMANGGYAIIKMWGYGSKVEGRAGFRGNHMVV